MPDPGLDQKVPVPIATPTSPILRRLVMKILNNDTDLEAFCIDHFRQSVYDRFTAGMERGQKVTLLLREAKGEEIFAHLQSDYRELVASALPQIESEVAAEALRGYPFKPALAITLITAVAIALGVVCFILRPASPNPVLAGYLCGVNGTAIRVGTVDALDEKGVSLAVAPGRMDDDGFFVIELRSPSAQTLRFYGLPGGCATMEAPLKSGVVTEKTCAGRPHHQPAYIAIRSWSLSCDR